MHYSSFLSLLASALCATSSVQAIAPEGEQSVESIDNWIQQNANSLPADLETFLQHSRPYQRAIYSELDNESKGALWAAKFDNYASTQKSAAPEKDAIFKEINDFFASPDMSHEWLLELEEKVKETFDEDEQALFGKLGDGCEDGEGIGKRGEHSYCDCSVGSYWTCNGAGGFLCRVDSGCMPPNKPDGCGFLQWYPCNGLCWW